jgi:hypothetical protein
LTHPDPGIKSLKDNPLKIGETKQDASGRVVATGGSFGDLISNIQANAVGMLVASQTNRANNRIYDFLTGELGHEVETIKEKTGIEVHTLGEGEKKAAQRSNERDAVMFYKDGQKVYWKAMGDQDATYGLSIAMAGLRPDEMSAVNTWLRKFNSFFRSVITNTPAFALGSMVRDMGQAYVQNGINPADILARNKDMLAESMTGYSDATKDLILGAGVGAYQLGGSMDVRAENIRMLSQ